MPQRVLGTAPGVGVDIVVGLRSRQAECILAAAEGNAIFRAGQNFQYGLDAHFPGGAVAQPALELGAVYALQQQTLGGAVHPADIGEVEPVAGIVLAKRPVPQRTDGTGTLRATAQPEILVGVEGQRGTGMVHEMAADHVGAIGNAVGKAVAGGHQQQSRGLDAIGGDNEGAAGDPVAVAFGVVVVGGDNTILRIMLQLVYHRAGNQPDPGRFRCRRRNATVVLRVHRADRLAVVAAAAGRAPVEGTAVARHRVVGNPIGAGQPLADTAHGPGLGHRLHGVRLAARRLGMLVAISGDAHQFFGPLVVGVQLVVVERPVHAHAVQAVHAHVVGHVAPGQRRPVPGAAAHHADILRRIGIGAGLNQMLVVLGAIDRVRRPGREGIGGHPVAAPGRVAEVRHQLGPFDPRSGFQHDHRGATLGQHHSHQCPADARAYHHEIRRQLLSHRPTPCPAPEPNCRNRRSSSWAASAHHLPAGR